MAILCGVAGALSAFYHDSTDISDPHQRMIASHRMIAKMPTIAAMAYKYSIGQPFVYPRNDLDFASNFLQMCFAVPCEDYTPNPVSDPGNGPHLHSACRSRTKRVHLHGPSWRALPAPIRLHVSQPALHVCGARRMAAPMKQHC